MPKRSQSDSHKGSEGGNKKTDTAPTPRARGSKKGPPVETQQVIKASAKKKPKPAVWKQLPDSVVLWPAILYGRINAFAVREFDAVPSDVKLEKCYEERRKKHAVFSVKVGARDLWMIGDWTDLNCYSKRQFPTADEAYTFHVGYMLRLNGDHRPILVRRD